MSAADCRHMASSLPLLKTPQVVRDWFDVFVSLHIAVASCECHIHNAGIVPIYYSSLCCFFKSQKKYQICVLCKHLYLASYRRIQQVNIVSSLSNSDVCLPLNIWRFVNFCDCCGHPHSFLFTSLVMLMRTSSNYIAALHYHCCPVSCF